MEIFGEIAIWITVLFNLVGALILCWALADGFFVGKHWTVKIAVMLMISGLVGQFARSYIALTTGIAPTDAQVPFWVLKDIGIIMYAVHYLLQVLGYLRVIVKTVDKDEQ